MSLRRASLVLAVFVGLHLGAAAASASELGCSDSPDGATVTCGEMIANARAAILQMQSRDAASEKKQKRLCAGKKNAKVRKAKNFSARQMKSNNCLAARNGAAATEVLRAMLELGLLDAKSQCQACNA